MTNEGEGAAAAGASSSASEGTPLIASSGDGGAKKKGNNAIYRAIFNIRDKFRSMEDEANAAAADRGIAWTADDQYNDSVRDMTYGRRWARVLSRFAWYNPRVGKPSEGGEGGGGAGPSIDKAWAYFEHVTLARHFVEDDDSSSATDKRNVLSKERLKKSSRKSTARSSMHDVRLQLEANGRKKGKGLEKAEKGESDFPTRLYSFFGTPEPDLADFGMGVGIYFWTLRALGIITFLAGLINLPNMWYFAGGLYNNDEHGGVRPILRSSAICTDQTWAACPTCSQDQWDESSFVETYDRHAETADGSRFFIKVNGCNVDFAEGFVSWLSLMFVCVSIYVMGKFSEKREVAFDEAMQTTTDYSVQVTNPPGDATDPDEWKSFFEQFADEEEDGHAAGNIVIACTVALDNEELVRALVKRRELCLALQDLLPAGVSFDGFDLDQAAKDALPLTWWQTLSMMYDDAPTIRTKIRKLDEDIAKRSDEIYDASSVFVTFETEGAQRRALSALSVRKLDAWRGNAKAMPKELLFRGEHLLDVREPPEPSSVRWQDLDESTMTRITQRSFTTLLSLVCILGGCAIIYFVRKRYGAAVTALTITALNTGTPYVCEYINDYESHASEGSKQASLYIKITAFLFINTVLVTAMITPFADTLGNTEEAMIPAMYAIFITEMLKAPVTQILDPEGHFYRHFMGPRALDQRRMNYWFQGITYSLSERYTDMTNVLFLTFYFATLFPAGFFFASLTLMVHYATDKFCLLRNWAPAPLIGTDLAEFSRSYFFTMALFVFALVSSYNFASFPYDNACEDASPLDPSYVGDFVAYDGHGTQVNVSIAEGDSQYFFCNQDLLRYSPPAFPAVPREQPEGQEWMSEGQARMSALYGWTSVGVLALVGLTFLDKIVIKTLRELFVKPYKPSGKASEEHFSEVAEIFGYVPQVKIEGYTFPVLLCDVSGLDPELIGWTDPFHSYDYYNVIFDVPGLVTKAAMNPQSATDDVDASEENEKEETGIEMGSGTRSPGASCKESVVFRDLFEEKPVFSIVKYWPPHHHHHH